LRWHDADAVTDKRISKAADDIRHAIVPTRTAPQADFQPAYRQRILVVNDDKIRRLPLIEAADFADSLAAEVHEGRRLHEQHGLSGDFDGGGVGTKLLVFAPGSAELARQRFHDAKTDIVACPVVTGSGISQTRNDTHRHRY